MSADAMARLRGRLLSQDAMAELRRRALSTIPASEYAHLMVDQEDLRVVLDRAALFDEALDALAGALRVLRESDAADVWEEETDAVKAVLAKAGRR